MCVSLPVLRSVRQVVLDKSSSDDQLLEALRAELQRLKKSQQAALSAAQQAAAAQTTTTATMHGGKLATTTTTSSSAKTAAAARYGAGGRRIEEDGLGYLSEPCILCVCCVVLCCVCQVWRSIVVAVGGGGAAGPTERGDPAAAAAVQEPGRADRLAGRGAEGPEEGEGRAQGILIPTDWLALGQGLLLYLHNTPSCHIYAMGTTLSRLSLSLGILKAARFLTATSYNHCTCERLNATHNTVVRYHEHK